MSDSQCHLVTATSSRSIAVGNSSAAAFLQGFPYGGHASSRCGPAGGKRAEPRPRGPQVSPAGTGPKPHGFPSERPPRGATACPVSSWSYGDVYLLRHVESHVL